MKKRKYSIASLLLLLNFIIITPFFYSCEDEVDVFSGEPSVPIIYCLLNPFDSVQYVRIGRTYIVEKGTIGIPNSADSLFFPGEIEVSLERWNEDIVEETILFEPYNEVSKDEGLFPSDLNKLFRTDRKIFPNTKYVLYVYLKDRELILDAEAMMVGELNVIDPFPLPERRMTLSIDQDYVMRWDLAPEAWIYQAVVTFHYDEIIGTDTIQKSFDWVQNVSQPDFLTREFITMRLNGARFYQEMNNSIEQNSAVKRKAVDISITFYFGGVELRFYVESIKPSSSILQEKPSYSNFNYCEGVFSSLATKKIDGIELSNIFIDSIAGSKMTENLSFVNSKDSLYIQ